MKEKRSVSAGDGEALAREYGIPFFETSAKTGSNVEEVRTYVMMLILAQTLKKLWQSLLLAYAIEPKV